MSAEFAAQGCPHLADLDGEEEKESMLKRYKTVISWHMSRRYEAMHPAKRRKVVALRSPRVVTEDGC